MEVQQRAGGQSINQTMGWVGRIRLSKRPREKTRSLKEPDKSFDTQITTNLNINTTLHTHSYLPR